MRVLRYRGNTYTSPEPVAQAAQPGARSYRWVKYDVEATKVVAFPQHDGSVNKQQLAA